MDDCRYVVGFVVVERRAAGARCRNDYHLVLSLSNDVVAVSSARTAAGRGATSGVAGFVATVVIGAGTEVGTARIAARIARR